MFCICVPALKRAFDLTYHRYEKGITLKNIKCIFYYISIELFLAEDGACTSRKYTRNKKDGATLSSAHYKLVCIVNVNNARSCLVIEIRDRFAVRSALKTRVYL